jgi:aminomethyltransferase
LIEGQWPAAAGDLIQAAEKEVGKITSSIVSPSLGRPIALGYVIQDYREPGTELTVRRAGTKMRASVTKLPFIASS